MHSNTLILILSTLVSLVSVVGAGSNEASKMWLEENSKKEGVITLSSGLQYKVVREGTGEDHPTVDSPCLCHYEGKLIDGTIFDSSYGRGEPTTFAPNQVIKGWTEAMQLMTTGAKWELYIPSELAYGDRGSPPKIGGGDALIFTIEILEIKGGKTPAVVCNPVDLYKCNGEEREYAKKIQTKFGKDVEAMRKEIGRIERVTKDVDEELKHWGKVRTTLLNRMILHYLKQDSSKDEAAEL
mmetsp:Transcript_26267/g.37648  ORF Transcript_26267/g.37648 Transcript_26267/m.37648 type:complete len:240 (+) Transcript_26267:88-807(+)|eukprot:CAMPEP_0172414334 /NCGR_PEP_ID=MMETSP1064-20121228/1010_1 /TAXON_ID=202472 /ORGANISM="Aulacoseira subarctica , Strain CCAP 1002/5" /LENGTH=239 /DNA_ID=CAMNT_0013150963 /DNA_START=60 /DNA_END=779 /DNA_ORIENTATION=+